MVRDAKNYVKTVEELKKNIGKTMGDVDTLCMLDSNTLEMLQLSLKVIDATNNLIMSMAYSVDAIERKLDKLSEKK